MRYIPGVRNVEADRASRMELMKDEYSINPKGMHKITKELDTPTMDLFASRLNTQCNKYMTKESDAFSIR